MCKAHSFKINAKFLPMTVMLIALTVIQGSASQAQSKTGSVTIASVSTHASAGGTVVSIAADGPLNRAQTWQDREGYHVVVPSGGAQNAIEVSNGIRLKQSERSLEIVIQTKPGANVTAEPRANRLNLNVEGKLDPREAMPASNEILSPSGSRATTPAEKGMPGAAQKLTSPAPAGLIAQNTSSDVDPGASRPYEPGVSPGESSVISGTTVAILIGGLCCLGGLLVLRRRTSSHATAMSLDEDLSDLAPDELDFSNERSLSSRKAKSSGSQGNGTIGSLAQRKSVARPPVAIPTALYGAYQVDQEVGKLVQGQPHRMDVVASRAPDDQ